MNKTTKTILGVVIVIIVAFLVWYGVSNKEEAGEKIIKLGYIGPLSGPGASIGQTELNAAQMAVDEINAKGGVKGYKFELIPEDGKCEGKEATVAAQKLVNIDKVKIILGGACSSETIAAASITEPNKVLLITDLSSNPSISDLGEYIFRLTPTDKDIYTPTAEILFQRYNLKEIGVISENTDYGKTALEAFVKKFKELGGNVLEQILVNPDQRDYKTEIIKIKSKEVKNVLIIPQTPQTGGLIAKQTKELIPGINIYGAYSMESEDAIKASQGALEGAIVVSISSKNFPSSLSKNVYDKYKSKYGEPADFISLFGSYDRVYVVAQALESCGRLDADCMKDYLYSNRFNLSLGEYGFDNKGDIDTFYLAIFKIENGKANPIEAMIKFEKKE
jgi:branched-chain amino acid transport system substrate-binding protein